jgi:hypothetical protein
VSFNRRVTYRAYATKRTYFKRDWFILATGKRWRVWLRARWYTLAHRKSLAHVIHERSWAEFERVMVRAGYRIGK